MKTLSFTVDVPRRRRRAVELYSRDTPFRPRTERNRVLYRRKIKHPNRNDQE